MAIVDKYISHITPLDSLDTYKIRAIKLGSSDIGSATLPIYLDNGTPKPLSNNNVLINLASETEDSIYKTSPRPGITGILPVDHGGTGNTSFTANRLIYTSTANQLSSSNIVSDGSSIGEAIDGGLIILNQSDYHYNTLVGTSGDTTVFRTGILKQVAAKHNRSNPTLFMGTYLPNSKAWMIGHVYNPNDVDSTSGLPRYSTFLGTNLASKHPWIFGTTNYVEYEYALVSSSNDMWINQGTTNHLAYYSAAGTITAYSSTNGGTKKLWYLNAGVPTDSTETVGATDKPIFLSSGTITESTSTIGSGIIPIYMASGQIKASTSTAGTATKPIWLDGGTIKAGTYELKATVDNGTQHYLTMYTTADGRTIGPASNRASTVLLSSTVADTLKLTSSANTNYLTYTSSKGTWKTGMGSNVDEYWIYSNTLEHQSLILNKQYLLLYTNGFQQQTGVTDTKYGGIQLRDTNNAYLGILRSYKSTSNTMGVQLMTYGIDNNASTFAIYRTSTPDTYITWTGGKIGNSIYPWANATYNIGSNNLAWNQLHLTYDSSSARNKGIRFMNAGTLVGNIGATANGLGIYGNGYLYLRPSLTEIQGMEITSTAVQPATNHDINLGTTSLRWNQIHAKSYYIEDTRNEDLTAATNDKAIRFFFSSNNMPDSKYWSGIHVRGWNGGYSSWELVGPAHNSDQRTTPLYIKTSNINTGWGEWRPILDSYNGVMRFHYGETGITTKILITINNTSSWMVSFTLRLYQGYQATDLQISGYNYNNADSPWSSPQAIILGSTAYDGPLVYFGYTDTQKLWVAVDGARYTGVDVFGVTNGYTQINLKDFCTITNVSILPGTLQKTVRAYSRLTHNVVSDTGDITLHNQPGTFAFSGNGDPWSGNDWVGFQVGNNVDKFQIVRVDSNNLLFRQNDNGGVNASWGAWEKILTDVNTSWEAWTPGTTAGPQANLSLSGTNIKSAAIPSASTSASGIVTTGAQQFKGRKKFGYLELYGEDAGTAKQYLSIIGKNNAGTQVAEIYYDFGNTTNITTGVWSFRQWSPNSTANTATSGGYETYSLPTVTTGLSSGNHGYSILTTKNTVTVAQGGTGNNTFTKNRLIWTSENTKLSSATNLWTDGTTIRFLKEDPNKLYALLQNTYNSTVYDTLVDYQNGNIVLNAASSGLYLGYSNTTYIDFIHGLGRWTNTGLGVGTTSPSYKLHVVGTGYFTDTVHINKNSGSGPVDADTAPLLIGKLTGASLAIGNNAIQARSNHITSTLWFNYEGGSASFGSSTSKTVPTTFFGAVTPGANSTYDLGTTDTLRWKSGFFTTSLRVGAINTTATPNSPVNSRSVYIGPDGFYANSVDVTSATQSNFVLRGKGKDYAKLYIEILGVADTAGRAILTLGNSTASTAADSAYGKLILYGHTTKYSSIESSADIKGHHLNYLPIYSETGISTYYGRLVGIYKGTSSGSTSGFSDVGSPSQPVYVTANGVVKAITGAIANNTTGQAAGISASGGTTGKFWRGDNTWSNELTGNLLLSASDTSDRYFQAANTNGSVRLYTSTNRGVYDSTNSQWMLMIKSADKSIHLKGKSGSTAASTGAEALVATYAGSLTYSYNIAAATTGLYATSNNANAILTLNKYTGTTYTSQLGFSSNGNIYYRNFGNANIDTTTTWKQLAFTSSNITGNAATATAANITSTDNAIVRFDGTAGEFQNSKALVDDAGGITVGGGYLTIKPYSSTYDTTGSHAGIRFYFNHDRSGYKADTLITSYSLQATNFYGALKGNADTATTANAVKTTLMTNASTAIYVLGATDTAADTSATVYKGYRTSTAKVYFRGDTGVLMGAAWNDYAEYRQAKNDVEIEPGRVVKEVGDETLELTTERLQKGCSIVSNTFGISIGESEINKLPLAVAGRVLAYPYESKEEFKNHIGWPVCSGPNGTVSIMTEEEEIKYPSRIIGTISAVPDYEIWRGGADVIVDGRVWIKVR